MMAGGASSDQFVSIWVSMLLYARRTQAKLWLFPGNGGNIGGNNG
jgi:hypothetical protein